MKIHENAEKRLKENIVILYSDLKTAIEVFIREDNALGDLRKINAYLNATLNAMISYIERLIQCGEWENDETVKALKYANNIQKHNVCLVELARVVGGMVYGFPTEEESGLELRIVWDDCIGLSTKSKEQEVCFRKIFQQRGIIETLEPIVNKLIS